MFLSQLKCFILMISFITVIGASTTFQNLPSKLKGKDKFQINVPHKNFEIVFSIEDEDPKGRRKDDSTYSHNMPKKKNEVIRRPNHQRQPSKRGYYHEYVSENHPENGPYGLDDGTLNWVFKWFLRFFHVFHTDPSRRASSPQYGNSYGSMMKKPKTKKPCNCNRQRGKIEYVKMALKGIRRLKTVFKNVKKKIPLT